MQKAASRAHTALCVVSTHRNGSGPHLPKNDVQGHASSLSQHYLQDSREGLRVRGLSSPCALFFKSLVVADFNSRFWKCASNKATEIFKQHHQPSRYCDYWSLSSLKSLVLLNKVARLFMGLHRNSFGELVPQQTIITTVFCDVS